MEIYKLATGDIVYRYAKSIVIHFVGERKVLSTSLFNGGYNEHYRAVFNHDATQGSGMPCKVLADTYQEHMSIVAEQLGLNPEEVTGVGTAASMNNVAIKTLTYEDFNVTAIVTGGIETNGGRVGDPATYYKPVYKELPPGTINIILVFNCDMPPGIMARALVTCTEAKTAAIQELLAGSNYSNGLATGSGTDQTIVVADKTSSMSIESTGKHAKVGELIGLVVIQAVKEALNKQTGLSPDSQHNALKRLKRFGATEDFFWECYKKNNMAANTFKAEFINLLEKLANENIMVTMTSLYIHLLDQYLWELLQEEETIIAANKILDDMAGDYNVSAIHLVDVSVAEFNDKLAELFIRIIKTRM